MDWSLFTFAALALSGSMALIAVQSLVRRAIDSV